MIDGSTLLIAMGIFVAEMCVVTVGTLRIIFVARGRRLLAPLLGFFEVTIWLFAIGQTMQNLTSASCFLAFALGFTTGNFLGMLIEKKLAMGKVLVRIVTPHDTDTLAGELRAANFGFTCINGEGATGPVRIIMTVVRRRQLDEVLRLIEACQPRAFYAVDDLQSASEGIFPLTASRRGGVMPSLLQWWRNWEGRQAPELMMAAAEQQTEDGPGRRDEARQAA